MQTPVSDTNGQFLVVSEGAMRLCDQAGVIFAIDMSDCVHVEAVYRVKNDASGELERLEIHGCWHDPSDPLHIVVHSSAGALFEGWGTDH